MPTKHYKALRPDLSKGRGEQASYSPQCYRALRLIAREVSLSLFLSREPHRGTGRWTAMTREVHDRAVQKLNASSYVSRAAG